MLAKIKRPLRINHAKLPPSSSLASILCVWIGAGAAIAALALVSESTHLIWVLGSFCASSVLIFAAPQAAFSQPRNIILGYLLSALIGLACVVYLGDQWWAIGIAVSTAIAVMMLTRTVHPPAGSSPVVIFLAHPDGYLFVATCLGGAMLMVFVAWLYHSVVKHHEYPVYW
jgi:CBS-domain-containing membrane protein